MVNCLKKLSDYDEWYYYPVVNIEDEEHQAEMYFIKLHKDSKHTFMFEVYKENEYNLQNILSLLKQNSIDPVFLGYPYGLIEADKFARVTAQEKEYYQTIIITHLAKKWMIPLISLTATIF